MDWISSTEIPTTCSVISFPLDFFLSEWFYKTETKIRAHHCEFTRVKTERDAHTGLSIQGYRLMKMNFLDVYDENCFGGIHRRPSRIPCLDDKVREPSRLHSCAATGRK